MTYLHVVCAVGGGGGGACLLNVMQELHLGVVTKKTNKMFIYICIQTIQVLTQFSDKYI